MVALPPLNPDLAYSFIPPVFYHATIPLTTHISVIWGISAPPPIFLSLAFFRLSDKAYKNSNQQHHLNDLQPIHTVIFYRIIHRCLLLFSIDADVVFSIYHFNLTVNTLCINVQILHRVRNLDRFIYSGRTCSHFIAVWIDNICIVFMLRGAILNNRL